MTGRLVNPQLMTDAQLAAALRAYLPAHAQTGLRDKIAADVAKTRQSPRLAWALGVADANPIARRRALLVLAILAILAAVSIAAVGAWLREENQDVLTRQPSEVDAFVLGSYQTFAQLPPFRLVTTEDGSLYATYFFDGSMLREETRDGGVRIFGPAVDADVAELDGRPIWIMRPAQARNVLGDMLIAWRETNCQSGWKHVEFVELLGRSARRVRCAQDEGAPEAFTEVWVDLVTGLPLRRVSPIYMGSVVEAQSVLEITELEFGPQKPDLFLVTGEAISQTAFVCATEHVCASPEPSTIPPSATPVLSPHRRRLPVRTHATSRRMSPRC
jgi:hypothetical protein